MNSFAKLTTLAVTAIVLSTTMASAFTIDMSNPFPAVKKPAKKDPVTIDMGNPFPGIGKPHFDPSDIDLSNVNFGGKPGKSTKNGGQPGIVVALGCTLAGSPGDLLLVNRSAMTLPAGTHIQWQVKAMGLTGYFALNVDLPAGKGAKAPGIIEGGADAGLPCSAKVI